MTALALETEQLRAWSVLKRNWLALAVVTAMAALFIAAAASVAVQSLYPRPEANGQPAIVPVVQARLHQAAEATSATAIQQIAPDTALAINASIPVTNSANPAAAPFNTASMSAATRLRSLDCLTAAIYYEAANEPTDGQRAVAQVVLNRVRHPAYPNSVCGVVFEGARRYTGCQFSFSCDGSLRRAPMPAVWERAKRVAEAALSGHVYAPVGWATHYHANYVVPYWSSTLVKSANIGLHIFYRWRGGWGRPAAFINHYAGVEPAIAWRGGFGQPIGGPAGALASNRDQLAAQAAASIAPTASVDSFQRAVLRRYEPLQPETANAAISARARADTTLSTSNRWALTGDSSAGSAQAPLGRRDAATPPAATPGRRTSAVQPSELQGVRYRADPVPAPAAAGGGGNGAEPPAL
jgi:spore germination cell wall hydrolase CwlJ-like protein